MNAKAPRFPLPKLKVYKTVDFTRVEVPELSKARNAREAALWRWAWRQPQSEIWAEQPWFEYLVAQWVRMSVTCEQEDAKAADKTTMIRLADQIGMTPAGLAFNGWVIGGVEPVEARAGGVKRERSRSSRERMGFEVVPGGVA